MPNANSVMSVLHCAIIVLLLLATLSARTSRAVPINCCQKTKDTKVPVNQLVSYSFQDPALCPVIAVRFFTKKGSTICSDPSSKWAKYAIKVINRRKSAQQNGLKVTKCQAVEIPTNSMGTPTPTQLTGLTST